MDPPAVPPSQTPATAPEDVVLRSVEQASTVESTVDPFLYYTRPGRDSTVDSTATREITWSITPAPPPRGSIPPVIQSTPAPRESKILATSAKASKTSTQKSAPAGKVTAAEQLILMNHVTQHMGEWSRGKSEFWNKIAKLFQEDTGKFGLYSLSLHTN
jgi:hypothetical protein